MTAPDHAVTLWVKGDNFCVRFPDQHSVAIPISSPALLVRILRERERLAKGATIGTEGAPVQYDIDAIARQLASTNALAARGQAVARREVRVLRERKALENRVRKRVDREEADKWLAELGI